MTKETYYMEKETYCVAKEGRLFHPASPALAKSLISSE